MAILSITRWGAIISFATLFISVALVALSTTIFYMTIHGMQTMDKAYPPGRYQWYRGPSWDMDRKHMINLSYDSANEGVILASGAVSILAGLVGIVGFFVTRKETNKTNAKKSIVYFLALPGTIALIATLISFIFSSVIFSSNNNGHCYWESGYNPEVHMKCTRELASCNIASYFTSGPWWKLRSACGATQTGRHLVAPLFVASALMSGLGVAKLVLNRNRQNEYVEGADERVERLQRQEL